MTIENRYGKPWARYEYILVLNQYMKMPFGKMHRSNAEIIALASLMKRTPNSVAIRLVNFAACDPVLASRSIKGLSGGKNSVCRIGKNFVMIERLLCLRARKF